VKTELDLGDHSEWIRVKRDSTLCELHNGDTGILCGWPNFGKKSCVFVPLILIYFQFYAIPGFYVKTKYSSYA
jgi:hypothetical protein